MRVSEVIGVSEHKKSYVRRRRILRMLILIFGLASIVVIVLTYYGHNAGNFSIRINDRDNRALVVSESHEGLTTDPRQRLSAAAIRNANDMTFTDIYPSQQFYQAISGNGQFNDPRFSYLAYSFYVKNTSMHGIAGTLVYSMRVLDDFRGMASALRVMIVTQDMGQAGYSLEVFRQYDPLINSGNGGQGITWPETEWANNQVFQRTLLSFPGGQFRKFTVFIWLEGNDPNTNDSILGGRSRFEMTLTLLGAD